MTAVVLIVVLLAALAAVVVSYHLDPVPLRATGRGGRRGRL